MDVLRSCYSTLMRFKAGDDQLSLVNWYFCPTGADIFENHHAFGSLNWSHGSPAGNVVGEVIGAPRTYSKGVNPGTVGTNFCGDVSDYLGIASFLETPRPTYPYGIPMCCNPSEVVTCQWWQIGHDQSLDTATMLTTGYSIRIVQRSENQNYYRVSGPIGFDLVDYAIAQNCLGRADATNVVAISDGDQFNCEFISSTYDGTVGVWQTPNIPGEIPVTQIRITHNNT